MGSQLETKLDGHGWFGFGPSQYTSSSYEVWYFSSSKAKILSWEATDAITRGISHKTNFKNKINVVVIQTQHGKGKRSKMDIKKVWTT